MEKYHSDAATGGRGHRLVVARHPSVKVAPGQGTSGRMWPMEIEPKLGGAGPFGSSVTVWEPPHRYSNREDGDNQYDGAANHTACSRMTVPFPLTHGHLSADKAKRCPHAQMVRACGAAACLHAGPSGVTVDVDGPYRGRVGY